MELQNILLIKLDRFEIKKHIGEKYEKIINIIYRINDCGGKHVWRSYWMQQRKR